MSGAESGARPARAGLVFLVALGAVGVTLWLADGGRLSGPPSVADYLAGRASPWPARAARGLPPALAGAATALVLLLVRPWRRRAGTFGIVAAAVLATAATSAFFAAVPGLAADWPAPTAAVLGLVAVAIAPALRDRGVVTLALASGAVALPILLARRATLEHALETRLLAGARDAVLDLGMARAFASVAPAAPLAFRQALALSLAPPFTKEPIALLEVEHDQPEQDDLRRAGWSGVRLETTRAQPLGPLAPVLAPQPFDHVTVVWRGGLGPVAIVRPWDQHYVLRVITPAGVVRDAGRAPETGLALGAPARELLTRLLAPFPAGTLVLAQVETDPPTFASGWQSLAKGP